MKIEICGCSATCWDGGRTTALLIDDTILIDAGSGLSSLDHHRACRIKNVFITHSHMDHICCLPFLVSNNIFEHGGMDSVTVHGLESTLDALKENVFNNVVWPDPACAVSSAVTAFRLAPVRVGDFISVDNKIIEPLSASHTLPALGFIIRDREHSVVVSGDTTKNAQLWKQAGNAENLAAVFVETSFPDSMRDTAVRTGHYSPGLLRDDMREAGGIDCPVYICHIKAGHEERIKRELRGHLPDCGLHFPKAGDVIMTGNINSE